MLEILYKVFACHFLGDLALQTQFLSDTKGTNWWHLIAHCFIYSVPFAFAFGLDYRVAIILISHFPVDALTSRYHKISKVTDQIIHVVIMCLVYFLLK